jgi:cyclopropane-fatty-acyl-phospholipid synthase
MCKGDVPTVASSKGGAANDDGTPRRVAIIGGGVAGLSAAWHLSENVASNEVDVQLFEAEDRLGGHAYTVAVNNKDGTKSTDVDIGFMVFNESNYPNMVRWFDKLGIPDEDTDMSLSVSLDKGETIEWNSDGINGLLARRGQAFDPKFYSMLNDMVRFNKEAAELLLLPDDDPRKAITTGQYLRTHGYSQAFGMYYLLPMMAALWSASMEDVLAFPAVQLISFLCNHKMLQLLDRPQVSLHVFLKNDNHYRLHYVNSMLTSSLFVVSS